MNALCWEDKGPRKTMKEYPLPPSLQPAGSSEGSPPFLFGAEGPQQGTSGLEAHHTWAGRRAATWASTAAHGLSTGASAKPGDCPGVKPHAGSEACQPPRRSSGTRAVGYESSFLGRVQE